MAISAMKYDSTSAESLLSVEWLCGDGVFVSIEAEAVRLAKCQVSSPVGSEMFPSIFSDAAVGKVKLYDMNLSLLGGGFSPY